MNWVGRYHRGAMREHRARKRAEALARQAARRHQACRRKRRFATREEAQDILLHCMIGRVLKHRTRRQERRVYSCSSCGGHHLTSKEDLYAEAAS